MIPIIFLKCHHEPFIIPSNILDVWNSNGIKGKENRESWEKIYNNSNYYEEINDLVLGKNLDNLESGLEDYKLSLAESQNSVATRKSSENVLNELTEMFSNLVGGSADLTGSNNTLAKNQKGISAKDFSGG